MSDGLNKAILIGNLGLDPELKYGQSGTAVLRLRVATSESYKDKQGDKQQATEWHTVVLFGKRADGLNRVLSKGTKLCVEGRIQHRSYEDREGNKRHATEIVASNVVLLGGGQSGGRSSSGGGPPASDFAEPGEGSPIDDDSDIPFAFDATWGGGR